MRSLALGAYWALHQGEGQDFKSVVSQWLRNTVVGRAHAGLATDVAPMLVLEHPDGHVSAHFMLRCDLWNSFRPEQDSRVVLAYDGQQLHALPRLSPCQNCERALSCSLASERVDSHISANSWLVLAQKQTNKQT